MSISSLTVSTDMSSDAGFRLWGQRYGAALTAFGWTQSTDTGQINWSTVTKPTATNTVAGYEIWKMADTLQSTTPIYMKLEFGTGSTATYSSLWLTVGFATDGAGTINSANASTRTQFANSLNSATTYPWKLSGSTNRFGFCESYTMASGYRWLFIERTHNNDGSDSATGVMLSFGSYTANAFCQMVPKTGGVPVQTNVGNCIGNCTGTGTIASNQWGAEVYLAPYRAFGMGESAPFFGVAGYFASDLTTSNVTTVTAWDGTSMNYLPLGIAPSYFSTISSINVAMRFD